MKTQTPRINKSQEGKVLYCRQQSFALLWISICSRIRMFFDLPDPHPDPFFILPYNELAIAQGPKIYQKKAL
jgi:hypothetical protein